jgi:hypothetical protein
MQVPTLHSIYPLNDADQLRRLLQDHPDLDINARDETGSTFLFRLACFGPRGNESLMWLIALRGMDLDPLIFGRMEECERAVTPREAVLWKGYDTGHYFLMLEVNRPRLVHEIRLDISFIEGDTTLFPQNLAASLFALSSWVHDGYLQSDGKTQSGRFFLMVSKLPMHLRMIACNRAFDIPLDRIDVQTLEPAFEHMSHEWGVADRFTRLTPL